MDAYIIIAIILAVVGIIGSVVPGLAGPPFSWIALLLLRFSDKADPVSTTALVVSAVAVVIVTVIDYILPPKMTSRMGGHKAASVGATIGLFAGMFLAPIGMIGGSLIGAFLGEFLVENRGVWASFKASIGTFLGFIITTVLKRVVAGVLFFMVLKISF